MRGKFYFFTILHKIVCGWKLTSFNTQLLTMTVVGTSFFCSNRNGGQRSWETELTQGNRGKYPLFQDHPVWMVDALIYSLRLVVGSKQVRSDWLYVSVMDY